LNIFYRLDIKQEAGFSTSFNFRDIFYILLFAPCNQSLNF